MNECSQWSLQKSPRKLKICLTALTETSRKEYNAFNDIYVKTVQKNKILASSKTKGQRSLILCIHNLKKKSFKYKDTLVETGPKFT